MTLPDTAVAIVGAGAAGLAAAHRLRALGVPHVVIEATDRIGGRARTTTPPLLDGAWIDEGATWLHAADRNPLVPLARAAGAALADAWADRDHHLFVGTSRATADEEAAYGRAEAEYGALLDRRAADDTRPDCSVAEAGAPFRDADPWGPTLEAWEAPVIAAADATVLSNRDCRHNALTGGDFAVGGGVGALVARVLAPVAPTVLHLGTAVTAIDRARAGAVRLDTGRGTLRAGAAIVTVSTGVLRAGAIRFTPALPHAHADALGRLPMGLLGKAAIRFRPGAVDRFDFDPERGGLVERRLERAGDPFLLLHVAPNGADHVVAWFGGAAAWAVASDPRAADDAVRRALAALFGAERVSRALVPGVHATSWGTDPCFRGAYAYAGPGDVDARAALGTPIEDGRLVFAGEAYRADGLAGTVGGAAEDGFRAAAIAAAAAARPGRAA